MFVFPKMPPKPELESVIDELHAGVNAPPELYMRRSDALSKKIKFSA